MTRYIITGEQVRAIGSRCMVNSEAWRILNSLPELPAVETEEHDCDSCADIAGFDVDALMSPAEPETCECAEPEPREAYRWNMSVAYHECRKCGKRIKLGRE